jgi:LmbE family N-acetylglucosaminyl deacetylase
MGSGGVIAIFAHPDDESILAGGTLAACADAGVETAVVSVTRGEWGSIARPEIATRETLARVREQELRIACGELGASVVECLSYPDASLTWCDRDAVARDLGDIVLGLVPDAVITFGRDGLYRHPDHVAVHDFVTHALASLREDGIAPSLYEATWPQHQMTALIASAAARGRRAEVWGLDDRKFGVPEESITTVVDVRGVLDRKLRAIRAHRSQLDEGNLFGDLDGELAELFLGHEYFRRIGANSAPDWLEAAMTANRSESCS